MKKSLVFAGIISLALLAGGFYGVSEIAEQKDRVVIYCQTLEGDVKEAEGIRFQMRTNWAERLFWDTKVTISDVSDGMVDSETVFTSDWESGATYSQRFYSPLLHSKEGVELFCENGTQIYGLSAQGLSLEESSIRFGKAAIDVASRAEGKETYTEVVKVSDYYEYYNIWMDVYSKRNQIWNVDGDDISDFFGIQVPDTHMIEVTIGKNAEDKVKNVEIRTVSGGVQDQFVNSSYMTEDGVYFAFHCVDEQGKMINTKTKVGNGLFYLPLKTVKDGVVEVMALDMKKVFSLPSENCWVVDVQMDEQQEQLLLLVREGNQLVLLVVDVAYMEEQQRIVLTDFTDEAALKQMDQVAGGLFVLLSDGSFSYITREDDGSYHKQITGSLGTDPRPERHTERPLSYDLDYQNGRLALICEESYYGSSAYVYVFGKESLLYKGYYLHCADYEGYFSNRIYLNEEAPLEIQF